MWFVFKAKWKKLQGKKKRIYIAFADKFVELIQRSAGLQAENPEKSHR
jgi:hypothetical protein